MLKFTFNTLTLFLFFITLVSGADALDNESNNTRMIEAKAFSNKFLFKQARQKLTSLSEDESLPWHIRLQALEELSNFNKVAAVQGYLRLLNTPKLRKGVTLQIEIQLTRLTPDLTIYQRVVRDPESKPLDHFTAAYCLQDWMSPEHAVYPFELLLQKIKQKSNSYSHAARNPDGAISSQEQMQSLIKLLDATRVIISVLESKFLDKTQNLPKLTER